MPVLLRETIELLSPAPGEVYVDCTAGLGGHASAVAERLGSEGGGTVVLFDLDPDNLAASKARIEALGSPPKVLTHHGSFAQVARVLSDFDVVADCVLADLGFASNQMDSPARGLSFMRDGPLDMRLNPRSPISAAELVNTLSERELCEIIRDFGEDDLARRIAAKLVQARESEPITTTARLAAVIREAVPRRPGPGGAIDPATKTFQALRIVVNDELGSLKRLLDAVGRAALAVRLGRDQGDSGEARPSSSWLQQGARVGVISFHSLEDRPVKRAFGEMVERGTGTLVNKKPAVARDEELALNPRSRSAKLRVIRIGEE